MSKIHTLLVDYWSVLKPYQPHLALSVIGGAKNFRMEGRKREIFKQGLISAAKSTNALILTGGNNTGSNIYFTFLKRVHPALSKMMRHFHIGQWRPEKSSIMCKK